MTKIIINHETGECTAECNHANSMELGAAVYGAIQAYADIKGVSYDAAKIKMMEILVKVESGIERENKMKAKFGEEFVKAFADFLKTMREKNDKKPPVTGISLPRLT